jgi:protein-tyrosine phosphatase/nicotinamidase-related amidase
MDRKPTGEDCVHEGPRSVLLTQCIQRDFVDPIGRYDPLPNQLHVGHVEAVRLLGEDPSVGPLAQLMDWVERVPPDAIQIVHIRDWHDPADPAQRDHLHAFGEHCLQGTIGARLVLDLDDIAAERPNHHIVDSLTLNDFEGTNLEQLLTPMVEARGELKVGVIGVWTEAKVSFLLYELKTRLGIDRLATCSALTASASRAQHFNALSQLVRLFGVECFESVAEFADWLRPGAQLHLPAPRGGVEPRIEVIGRDLAGGDRAIVAHLFRESRAVVMEPLSGGFSGATVFRATSTDSMGQSQAPSVVKLGPNRTIAQERVAFEQVEEVLGNNSPRVRGFVDLGDRAGLKYSYAAMGKAGVRTLKQLFETDEPIELLERVVAMVFDEVLEPLYAASRYERLPILAAYEFSPRQAPEVRRRVAALVPDIDDDVLVVPGGGLVPNVCRFYDRFLPSERLPDGDHHYTSLVHGDLNAANILMDDRGNVWVIDFYHSGPGHVLKDLAKLENDLLYILTPIVDDDLDQAISLTRALLEVDDLQAALPADLAHVRAPQLVRAWRMLRLLRQIGGRLCREDRDPLQLQVALLRYAVHTLGFDESSVAQKRWALVAAGLLSARVSDTIVTNEVLRIDWLDIGSGGFSSVGITICPGRRDRRRDLDADLATLVDRGVTRLLCLLPDSELAWAGVSDLRPRAQGAGIEYRQLAVPDQGTPGLHDAREAVSWCRVGVAAGGRVVITCMGGLGRSGTIAACYLVELGWSAPEAISAVRHSRGPRAVETRSQEAFVAAYAAVRQR